MALISSLNADIAAVRRAWEVVLDTSQEHFEAIVDWTRTVMQAVQKAKSLRLVTDYKGQRSSLYERARVHQLTEIVVQLPKIRTGHSISQYNVRLGDSRKDFDH